MLAFTVLLVGEARFRVGGLTSERAWERSSVMNERRRIPSRCSEDDAIVTILIFVVLGRRVTSQHGRVLKPRRHSLSCDLVLFLRRY